MKTYTFWYTEEVTYKAGFQAESLEHAKELLLGLQRGEANVDDLPEFWNSTKGVGTEISLDTLEGDE
jgi:hypothetical protein